MSQSDGVSLADVNIWNGCDESCRPLHIQPAWRRFCPGPNLMRRTCVSKFGNDLRRGENLFKQNWQHISTIDEHEIVKRRGIRDDNHLSANCRSLSRSS